MKVESGKMKNKSGWLKVVVIVCIGIVLHSPFTTHHSLCAQEHSPDVALRWSLIPGGGQIYNHQAWKVPIIYGAFAGMGYLIYDSYQDMKTFKDEYLYRVNHNDTPALEGYESYPTSNIYSLYNSYNRNFQLMIIITAGIYALNLVDAYVFGHLFDFQIDDDISMSMAPMLQLTPAGLAPTVGLSFQL